MVTVVIILIYIALNLACIGYYLRWRRDEFNPVWHLVVPLLGVLAFIPALLTALGVEAFDFITALSWPFSLAGPVVRRLVRARAALPAVPFRTPAPGPGDRTRRGVRPGRTAGCRRAAGCPRTIGRASAEVGGRAAVEGRAAG